MRTAPALALSALSAFVALASSPRAQFFAGGTVLAFGAGPRESNRGLVTNVDETVGVFASDRASGAGGWDLWIVTRATAGAPWGTPTNVRSVNTPADEIDPSLSPDGTELFFASDRRGGAGGFDLYTAPVVNGRVGTARPVPVNGAADETGPHVLEDGELWFAVRRSGRSSDIVRVQRDTAGNYGAVQRLPFNSNTDDDYDPCPVADGAIVWFSSRRRGGLGGADIWLTWRDRTSSSGWSAPLLVRGLSTPRDDDGFFTTNIGVTYHNQAAGALGDIFEINCVCRQANDGGTQSGANGEIDVLSDSSWPAPVQFALGADVPVGGVASFGFYTWKPGAESTSTYVPVIGIPRQGPVSVPRRLFLQGILELEPAFLISLGNVVPDQYGYGRLDVPTPSTLPPGTRVGFQAFGLTRRGFDMAPPQVLTFR